MKTIKEGLIKEIIDFIFCYNIKKEIYFVNENISLTENENLCTINKKKIKTLYYYPSDKGLKIVNYRILYKTQKDITYQLNKIPLLDLQLVKLKLYASNNKPFKYHQRKLNKRNN